MNSEEPVYEAVMKWVKHDTEKRKVWLSTLLQYVRLPLLSARYITDIVDNEVNNLARSRQNRKCSPNLKYNKIWDQNIVLLWKILIDFDFMLNIHGKQLRSCRAGQLSYTHFSLAGLT